ncbi:MAG TPA: hypothetical protein VH395_08885 [Jatrophihabitantaceae bacterium]|jgi:hypothetical protein
MTATETLPAPSPYMLGGPSYVVDVINRARGTIDVAGRARLAARAAANTLSGDVPGLIPEEEPEWVADAIRRRTTAMAATLDALRTTRLPPGSVPWVPDLPGGLTGGVQAGDKTQFVSQTIDVDGGPVPPVTVGFTTNVAWQAMQWRGDVVMLIAGEAAVATELGYVAAQLAAGAGAAAADLPAAIAAVEGAGYMPAFLFASRSAWAKVVETNPTGALSFAGLPVLFGPTGTSVYVIGAGGVWFADSPGFVWSITEPSIGGVEVGAFMFVVLRVAAGGVARVDTAA